MITLDTSGILALVDRREAAHKRSAAVLGSDTGPYLVPAGILCEVGYFLEKRLGASALNAFLADLQGGAFSLDCGEDDLPRVRELIVRYQDLPLGYSDATVIACAERNGGRVLTLDVRGFTVVAREGTITLLPQ